MKTYVKPELFYENFELSAHIAACAIDMTYQDANSCTGVLDAGDFGYAIPVFSETNKSCDTTFEDYCYTNGGSGSNTFAS